MSRPRIPNFKQSGIDQWNRYQKANQAKDQVKYIQAALTDDLVGSLDMMVRQLRIPHDQIDFERVCRPYFNAATKITTREQAIEVKEGFIQYFMDTYDVYQARDEMEEEKEEEEEEGEETE